MPAHPLDLAGREAALFQGADEPVHVTGVFQLQGAVNAVKIRAEGGQFLPAHIHNVAVALFLTDLFMVIAACFVFDLYTALYSFVGLTVKSLVIDAVLEKIKMCKAILIVCDDRKPICDFVMRKLVRGATYTPCFGAYTDKPHYIIYTTLTRREADQLQDFIHKQHLNAFMSMLSTTEVFGKGFNHA